MESLAIQANRRTLVGKQASTLRRSQRVPAVMYGHGVSSLPLEVEGLAIEKLYRQAGASSLVDLVIDDAQPVKVLIHDIQRHPLNQAITHIDFYQVKMTEKLQTDIELSFVGESPAVKEQGGILVRALDEVKVECLPADLVPSIEVDISSLKTFDDRIQVKDLVLPKGIEILDQGEEMVASVSAPRTEDELKELESTVSEDVSAVGSVEKAKPDEEEAAEGEAAEKPTS